MELAEVMAIEVACDRWAEACDQLAVGAYRAREAGLDATAAKIDTLRSELASIVRTTRDSLAGV